jgi:hypothetical protein
MHIKFSHRRWFLRSSVTWQTWLGLQVIKFGLTLARKGLQIIYINVRFWVLTAASMKMTAFSVAPFGLDGVNRRFRCAYCLRRLDDGGSTHLWNISLFQRHYTALYLRKLSSCLCEVSNPHIYKTSLYLPTPLKYNHNAYSSVSQTFTNRGPLHRRSAHTRTTPS